MSDQLKMPERQPDDGPISVIRPTDGVVSISVETGSRLSAVTMSEYNAWRVLGALSVVLGVPLSKAASKVVKF